MFMRANLVLLYCKVQAAFPRRNGYTCRASANPNNVNVMPPAMCSSNTAAASAYRAASSFSATSAEKAENVVKLPKNPVTKSSLHITKTATSKDGCFNISELHFSGGSHFGSVIHHFFLDAVAHFIANKAQDFSAIFFSKLCHGLIRVHHE